MAFDGLITAFLGHGATAARPAAPNVMPGAIVLWWSTSGALSGQLSMWTGAAWRENILQASITVQNDTSLASNSATDPPSVHAAKTYIDVAIAALVNSAPGALNTLKELADAINDDASVYTTLVALINAPPKALPLTFNFTANGEARFYADVAMTLTEQATSGTGTIAYEKSTAGAPGTFAATASPIALQAGAWLKVSASAITGIVAVHLKRTA